MTTGTPSSSHSMPGHRKLMSLWPSVRTRCARRWHAWRARGSRRCCLDVAGQRCAGRELAAPLAQVGKAQDRIDQIFAGGKLEGVHAGNAERLAQRALALLGERGEALAEAAGVRVCQQ